MKLLLTGVTGYLGGRIAQRFSDAGHHVRGLVRAGSVWDDQPDGAEQVVGDVTDLESIQRAAEGCETILHAAAHVRIWSKDRRISDAVNVEGLANVAEVARASGTRLIHVSSFIALGPTDGCTLDEDDSRINDDFHNDYERTKTLADRLARRLSAEGVPLVRLYPGVVFGPGALTQGNYVVQLLLQHARGDLPGMLGRGDLRQCFAYVDDVVDGALSALERAQPGSGYILGGENKTGQELFAAFEAASGIAPPRMKIPFAVAGLIGKLQRWRAELGGAEPELTDEVVGIYRHEWAYSSSRAERELGYAITPFQQAIQATVDWLRSCGELA